MSEGRVPPTWAFLTPLVTEPSILTKQNYSLSKNTQAITARMTFQCLIVQHLNWILKFLITILIRSQT